MDVWLFMGVCLALGIASGLAVMIVSVIFSLILLLVALLVFGFAYILLGVLLKAMFIFKIVSFLLGVPSVIVAFMVLTSLSLPSAIFFRNFSLYFLSSLDCGISPLMNEEKG